MTRDALLLELAATREQLLRSQSALVQREADLAREREERARQEAEVERLKAENLELKHRIDVMARRMFGRSSERLAPDQYLLAFEAAKAETEKTLEEDARETALGEVTERTPRPRRVKPSEKKGQKALPVRTVAVEPDAKDLACGCGATKQRIGAETSERVEYVPASLFVLRTVRGKYACAGCQEGVTIAPPPPQGLERSVAGPGLVAQVVSDKYANHLPLYRQEEIFAREGADLPRSTLGDIVGGAAELLEPLARRVMGSVLEGRVVNTDDTAVTYLLKPRGRATGAVWAYVGERSEVAYDFTRTRSRDGPAAVLRGYRGYLQADALKQYDALYTEGGIVEVACWAHARRYFFEALSSDRSLAEDIMERIRELYAVERRAKTASEAERLLLRQVQARPILKGIERWLAEHAGKVLPKGPMGQAIAYTTRNWTALTRYLEQGYLAIDNNAAERALRCVAVGRKNWLFAGSAEAGCRAATLMTLVNTCKLQGIDPQIYLADVLVRVATTPASRIDELTPRGWRLARERSAGT
jgi:transposase